MSLFLNNKCELLPVIVEDCKINYFQINVIEIKDDALDFEKSEFKYWEHAPDKIHYTKKFVFKENKLRNATIFKLKVDHYTNIFVTDIFKNKAHECNLKGFIFEEVWDSEKI